MTLSREEILRIMKENGYSVLAFANAHDCTAQQVWDVLNGK